MNHEEINLDGFKERKFKIRFNTEVEQSILFDFFENHSVGGVVFAEHLCGMSLRCVENEHYYFNTEFSVEDLYNFGFFRSFFNNNNKYSVVPRLEYNFRGISKYSGVYFVKNEDVALKEIIMDSQKNITLKNDDGQTFRKKGKSIYDLQDNQLSHAWCLKNQDKKFWCNFN